MTKMNGQLSILFNFVGMKYCSSTSVADISDEDDSLITECSSTSKLQHYPQSRMQGRSRIFRNAKDDMAELISLQKSNGLFEISNNEWTGSILEKHLGAYTEVKFGCPLGMNTYLWITALSMKILEIKMGDKKDLWDLVAQKSEKFLKEELKQDMENYKSLNDLAEKYVKSK